MPLTEEDEDEIVLARKKTDARLKAVLDQLSDDYRAILDLRFLKGYTVKEAAEELGISESNAKVRQFRALKKAQALIFEQE